MCIPPRGFIPTANTMRVQLVYTSYSQRIENVWHVKSGGGLLLADLNRVEAVFANWHTVTARPQIPNTVSLVLIVIDALDVNNGLHAEYTTGWTVLGSLGSASLPPQITSAIKLSTGFSGRSFRGRIYWPGISVNEAASGLWTTTRRDAVVAAVNTLRTSLLAGGDKLVVVSYCSAGAWRAAGVATEITGVSGHTTLNQQKRRTVSGA